MIHHFIEPHRFHPAPFDREGCAFRWSYYLRPWELACDTWRESRAILRRGLYGWDDSDIWSLDHYVATIMPQMLRHLKDNAYGAPMWCVTTTEDDPYGEHSDMDADREKWRNWLEEKA